MRSSNFVSNLFSCFWIMLNDRGCRTQCCCRLHLGSSSHTKQLWGTWIKPGLKVDGLIKKYRCQCHRLHQQVIPALVWTCLIKSFFSADSLCLKDFKPSKIQRSCNEVVIVVSVYDPIIFPLLDLNRDVQLITTMSFIVWGIKPECSAIKYDIYKVKQVTGSPPKPVSCLFM